MKRWFWRLLCRHVWHDHHPIRMGEYQGRSVQYVVQLCPHCGAERKVVR